MINEEITTFTSSKQQLVTYVCRCKNDLRQGNKDAQELLKQLEFFEIRRCNHSKSLSQLAATRKENEDKIKSLQTTTTRLETEIAVHHADLEALTITKGEIEASVSELKTIKTDVIKDIKTLKKNVMTELKNAKSAMLSDLEKAKQTVRQF